MTAPVLSAVTMAPIDFSGVDLGSPLAAATSYVSIGLRPVPIPFRSKNPGKRGWQRLHLKVEELHSHFPGGPQNIGILLGEPSQRLLDADGDCLEVVALMAELLPATDAVFGRASKPRSHYLYQSAGPCPKTTKLTDIDGKTTLIELRSTGAQTVFPPSEHAGTGESIRFERQGIAARVDPSDLIRAVRGVGAAALLARHWSKSVRHEAALGLAGWLLKAGWPPEEAEGFVGAIARVAEDEELQDRLRAVRTTAENLEAGRPVAGWTKLKDAVGREVASRVRNWLGISMAAISGSATASSGGYVATDEGIFHEVEKEDGVRRTRLTNFTAVITGDVIEDDGAERKRLIDVRCTLQGRNDDIRLPAASFASMNWPMDRLGPSFVVEPGLGIRDRARAAIQHLSGPDIPRSTIYTHTGWRQVEGAGWLYLHAGGSVGTVGTVHGVETRLEAGALARFRFRDPPGGDDLVTSIHASLSILDLGPDRVVVPCYASIWRAVLGGSDFGVFLVGPTGVFKSELAALLQQHFGSGMDRLHLPGSWSSTDNALEDLLFRCKDTLFVIDDFKPGGHIGENSRLHSKADRVFRGQGNSSGRQRMKSDTSLRPLRPPRALPLATGEELPLGHSLRARLVVVEVAPDDIDVARLSRCQRDAREGRYAEATSAFVQWLAGRRDEVQAKFRRRVLELRDELQGTHRRTAGNAAELLAALEVALEFARDATAEEAITAQEEVEFRRRFREAIVASANAQADAHAESDPVEQYLELLRSAIASGRAHLADRNGGVPPHGEVWGWEAPSTPGESGSWRSRGERVGWVDGGHVYLEPLAAYRAADAMCVQGQHISVSEKRLRRLLNDRGLLAERDTRRSRLTCRATLQGVRRDVLCLGAGVLVQPSQPSQPTPAGASDDLVGHSVGRSVGRVGSNRPSKPAQDAADSLRGSSPATAEAHR